MLVGKAENNRSPEVNGDQEWVQLKVACQQKWPVNNVAGDQNWVQSKVAGHHSGRSQNGRCGQKCIIGENTRVSTTAFAFQSSQCCEKFILRLLEWRLGVV